VSVALTSAVIQPEAGFAELSLVRTLRPVKEGRRVIPAGTLGTVVGVYSDGIGYEVEFARPFRAVVTFEASDLTA
jgi:hypothetical protein